MFLLSNTLECLHFAAAVSVIFLVLLPSNSFLAVSSVPNVTYVQTVAGKISGFVDGNGTDARFNHPVGVAVDDSTGTVYLSDYGNCAMRAISAAPPYRVTTIAGSPPSLGAQCTFLDAPIGTNARFDRPQSVCIHSGMLFLVEYGNNMVRSVSLTDNGSYAVSVFAGQSSLGYVNAPGTSAKFNGPAGIAYYAALDCLLIADYGNHAIRCVFLATRGVNTIAGSSTPGLVDGTSAKFYYPFGITTIPNTPLAYVADYYNMAIRVVNVSSRVVTTLAGSYPVASYGFVDGIGTAARLYYPLAIAYDSNSDGLVVVDEYNHALRWLNQSGSVTFLAGSPPPTAVSGAVDGNAATARFYYPQGIAVMQRSATTNTTAYVVGDAYNHILRFAYLDHPAPPPATTTPQPTPQPTLPPTTVIGTPSPPSPTPSPSSSHAPTGACNVSSISWNMYHDLPQGKDEHGDEVSNKTATIAPTPTTTTPSPFEQTGTAAPTDVPVSSSATFVVPLQPSTSPSSLSTPPGSGKVVTWSSVPIPRATLQRLPSLVLNLSASSSLYEMELRAVYLLLAGKPDGEAPLSVVATRLPLSVAAQHLPLASRPQHYAMTVSLIHDGQWVTPEATDGVASTIVALFAECNSGALTTLNIVILLGPDRSSFSVAVGVMTSAVGSATAMGSVTTATNAARVSAVRELLLCSSSGASSGGLLGMSIDRPALEDGGDDNLPSVRGAVVGNVIAVLVVGAVLSLLCCAYSVRCGVGLHASLLRLALPSTLMPILVAALPSTIGAVVYLASSNRPTAVNVTLAVIGVLLCALPLPYLVTVAFILPSRLQLVLAPNESAPRDRRHGNGPTYLASLRRYYDIVSEDLWIWKRHERHRSTPTTASPSSDKNATSGTHVNLDDDDHHGSSSSSTPPKDSGDGDVDDVTAPERVGRTVLMEHRLLWFCLLDIVVVGVVAALAVGGSFGGTGGCRASLGIVVALLVLETSVCVATKPYTTWRSQGLSVLTLILSTSGAILQLVASTLPAAAASTADSIVAASEALDLVVLVISSLRLIAIDIPEMVLAGRQLAKEMAAGPQRSARASLQPSSTSLTGMSNSFESNEPNTERSRGAGVNLSNVMQTGDVAESVGAASSTSRVAGDGGAPRDFGLSAHDENDFENLLALNPTIATKSATSSPSIRLGRANSTAAPSPASSPVLDRFVDSDASDSDDSDL